MISPNDVRIYRDAHNCSIQEAKLAVNKRDRIDRLEDIATDLECNGSVNMYEAVCALTNLMLEQENGS